MVVLAVIVMFAIGVALSYVIYAVISWHKVIRVLEDRRIAFYNPYRWGLPLDFRIDGCMDKTLDDYVIRQHYAMVEPDEVPTVAPDWEADADLIPIEEAGMAP